MYMVHSLFIFIFIFIIHIQVDAVLNVTTLYCDHCFVPVAVKDSVLDPPVHHVSAEHRVVVGVGVLLPLALGHGLPAVVEHVL